MNTNEALINEMEKHAEMAPICGGTVSAHSLRVAIEIRTRLSDDGHVRRIDAVIQKWRESLIRHNAQPMKCIEYNIDTGLEKE